MASRPATKRGPGAVAIAVTAALAAGALAAPAASAARFPLSSCLWRGPSAGNSSNPETNYAFPDSGAIYWSSQIELPAGATLILHGRYVHGRYQSLNSYGTAAEPTDALNDVGTSPDRGSRNPFAPGAARLLRNRSYTARIVAEPAPRSGAPRRANTLYAGVPGQARQRILYRVYVPDRGRDLTGGVGLPSPELRLAGGAVLKGAAACSALRVTDERLPLTTLPRSLYDSLRDQPGKPATFPAARVPVFRAFYNVSFSIACVYHGECSGTPVRTGGQYSNIDNSYVSAQVNRRFGKVLVLRGKLPRTPNTYPGPRRMPGGQMRYWSICQNESLYTTRGAGCLYDHQIPVDRRGYYTIVTSLAADRPANARARCGVGFVPWPSRGDGAGHPDDGLLLIRNMLPARGFRWAIQRTSRPGDERRVMGPYYPRGAYTSRAAFERRGCRR